MSTEHTPGPWKTTGLNVRAADGGLICTATNLWADQATPQDVKEANARLISCAPEMLEVLKRLLESAECLKEELDSSRGYCGEPESFRNARAVLSKVKGESGHWQEAE